MTIEEALQRLERAEDHIISLRDQIARERRDMRERYEAEMAMLRVQNHRLLNQLAASSMLSPWHPQIVKTSKNGTVTE